MFSEEWNARSELLNSFQFAIEERTRGRLSDLSVELVDEGVVIEARSETYHAVQLALAAIKMITAELPDNTPTTLVVEVNGHTLVLRTPCADHSTSRHGMREEIPVVHFPSRLEDQTTLPLRRHHRRRSLALSSRVDSGRLTSCDSCGSPQR